MAAQPGPLRPIQMAASGPENHVTPVNSSPAVSPAPHAATVGTAKPPVYQ